LELSDDNMKEMTLEEFVQEKLTNALKHRLYYRGMTAEFDDGGGMFYIPTITIRYVSLDNAFENLHTSVKLIDSFMKDSGATCCYPEEAIKTGFLRVTYEFVNGYDYGIHKRMIMKAYEK